MADSFEGQTFKKWLEKRHELIMGHEKEALDLLSKNDCDGYNLCMRKKAELICSIHSDAQDCGLLKTLPPDHAAEIETELGRFSSGAKISLELNSPFYMSALLYPDNHKPGEPDNLQKLLAKLP